MDTMRKRKTPGWEEDIVPSMLTKSRRLMVEEIPNSEICASTRTDSPFMGAKSVTGRVATYGQTGKELIGLCFNGLNAMRKKVEELPGELDTEKTNQSLCTNPATYAGRVFVQ